MFSKKSKFRARIPTVLTPCVKYKLPKDRIAACFLSDWSVRKPVISLSVLTSCHHHIQHNGFL